MSMACPIPKTNLDSNAKCLIKRCVRFVFIPICLLERPCFIYVIRVCFGYIVVSNTCWPFALQWRCLTRSRNCLPFASTWVHPVSCVPNILSVSGLSILNCPLRVSLTFIYVCVLFYRVWNFGLTDSLFL